MSLPACSGDSLNPGRLRFRQAGQRGLGMMGRLLLLSPIFPLQKGVSLVGFHSSFAAPAPHQPNSQQSYLFAGVISSSERLNPGQSPYIEASFGCIFGRFYCSGAGFVPARLSLRRQRCRTSQKAADATGGLVVLLPWSTSSDDQIGQGVLREDD